MRPPILTRPALMAALLAAGPPLLVLIGWHLASGRPGLLEVVADGVVRFVPLAVFDAVLAALGPLAKGLVYAAVTAVALLVAAVAGAVLLGRLRSRPPAVVGLVAALGGLLLAELVVLPAVGVGPFGTAGAYRPVDLHLPLIVAAVTFGLGLGAARAGGLDTARTSDAAAPAVDRARRAFLARSVTTAGAGSLALSSVGVVGQVLSAAAHNPTTTAAPATDGFGPTPAATPVGEFYTVAKDVIPPSVDGATWALAIDGLVDRPEKIGLDALRSLPAREADRTLECISTDIERGDHLIGNQRWRGVRVADLLDRVGVQAGAAFIHWEAEDGFTESIALEVARHPDTWIAYEMGGAPLPVDHGYPARVLIPGRFGMKQPKWVRRMTLAAEDADGYWVQRGWDRAAVERTMSRIDAPDGTGRLPVGQAVLVAGIAFAGDRGIRRVELSMDGGGTWVDAELEDASRAPLGPLTWVRWRRTVTFPAAGERTLVVRATDGTGATQPGESQPPLPSGSTGWHAVTISVG